MTFLYSLLESLGWIMFLYLGFAGAYELVGGRRVRATALLAGAIGWIAVTFSVLWMARRGVAAAILVSLIYFAALYWLGRTVQGSLGKPDMDVH